MKTKYFICVLSLVGFSIAALSAQESDFGGGSFFDSVSDGSGVDVGGRFTLPIRTEPEPAYLPDSDIGFVPELLLEADYSGDILDIHGGLITRIQEGGTEVSIDEAWVRGYAGIHDVEIGLMKITWGKGDQYHVMDPFNPFDYRQFVELGYTDRKNAEFMIRANLAQGDAGRLEMVYVPWFTADTYADDGKWTPRATTNLNAAGEAALDAYAAAYYAAAFAALGGDASAAGSASLQTAARLAEAKADFIRTEDTKTPGHWQGGLRFTHTAGALDWGLATARTFIRDPVVSAVDTNPATITELSDPHVAITYTPAWMAAQEAAFILGGWNFRQEAAVYLTQDFAGTDPDYRNHRLDWLLGFDKDLPVSRLNLNVQVHGHYVLGIDGLDSDDPDAADRFYGHRVIWEMSDSFARDTVIPSMAGSWNIEDGDWLLNPEVEVIVGDNLSLAFGSRLYEGGGETMFGQFDDRDNVYITCEASF